MLTLKRGLIAATIFFSLLTARAQGAIYTEHGRDNDTLYIGSNVCRETRRTQTSESATSGNPARRLRSGGRHQNTRATAGGNKFVCVDVLHSEELTGAPIFYRLVRVTLLITSPGGPAFETTIKKMIPWQTPPPRQGQRFRLRCDPA